MARKKSRRGQKQCPACKVWIKGTRAKTCLKCGHQFNGKPVQAPAAEPVVATAQKKAGDTVTVEQVKVVAQTVKAIGGYSRLNEFLSVIKEVGGVRRFKDLAEAMSAPEADDVRF